LSWVGLGWHGRADTFGAVIAGFFTGGALAVRGGLRAARNSAIGCACLLAVIEGVGIGIQRMMAENTRLDVCTPPNPPPQLFPRSFYLHITFTPMLLPSLCVADLALGDGWMFEERFG